MKTLFILKVGSTFEELALTRGDFDTWIKAALSETALPVGVIDVEQGAALPELDAIAGVIITGAHAMVTDKLSWSVCLESWLPALVRKSIPILGVCYGHQLLAEAMGGLVDYHPRGREIGTVSINIFPAAMEDPLFEAMDSPILAQVTHAQSVLVLPPNAVWLAGNDYEPHQAYRLGQCAWGVQFHPEYSCEIMQAYIDRQQPALTAAGYDVALLKSKVQDTPEARCVLQRFARVCLRLSS